MAHLTHWHILGSGSIGCLFGYYLRKAGHTVTFIEKDPSHNASISINCKIGEHNHRSAAVQRTHSATLQQTISHLLVCVKAYDTESAIASIQHSLADQAIVIVLQNGMVNIKKLNALLPHAQLFLASTTEASRKSDRYNIEHTGKGLTVIGEANHPLTSNKKSTETLLSTLHCELNIEWHPHIEKALWQKLLINCCINPLTVIFECQNGELANINPAQDMIKTILAECKMVAQALGKSDDLLGIEDTVNAVIHNTAKNTSSMRQDILSDRKTEIDHINGFIVKQANLLGIHVPTNVAMVTAITSYQAPTKEAHHETII